MNKHRPRWFYCSRCEFSFASRYRKGIRKLLLMPKCPICKTKEKVSVVVEHRVAKGTKVYEIE